MKHKLTRTITALALAALLLFAAGCAADFDEAGLEERSLAYAQNMSEGDFLPLMQDASREFMAATTPDGLAAAWVQTTAQMGDFEEVLPGPTYTEDGEEAHVGVTCSFENTNLLVAFSYNSKSELGGLWFSYEPKPIAAQSTDAWEEIPVTVGEGDAALPGLLTIPRGVEDPAAVVLVQGSGANDMDETIGAAGNKPFADIAHGLAERGIASIRYNKRTFEYPDALPAGELTIGYETLDDAAAAYAALAGHPGIDTGNIYILGHSLGAMMAPKIAQDTGAAGFISLAGSPRPLQQISYDQNMAVIDAAAAEITDVQRETATLQIDQMLEGANGAKEGDETLYFGLPANYWYSLNQVDNAAIAQSLSVPMLFLQGSEDFQVYADKDFADWQSLLAGDENASFKLYDGLNHLFMPSDGSKSVEEYNNPANVDPAVIADLAAWLAEQAA